MITGYLVGDRQLLARLGRMPEAMRAEVDKTVRELGYRLERLTVTGYLRGPRPVRLGFKTGRLAGSIASGGADSRSRFESTPGGSIAYVGTNVVYGVAWEHGFDRKVGAGARGGPRTLSGRSLATYIARHPPGVRSVAPRPFLGPALAELKPVIIKELGEAMTRGMQAAMRS